MVEVAINIHARVQLCSKTAQCAWMQFYVTRYNRLKTIRFFVSKRNQKWRSRNAIVCPKPFDLPHKVLNAKGEASSIFCRYARIAWDRMSTKQQNSGTNSLKINAYGQKMKKENETKYATDVVWVCVDSDKKTPAFHYLWSQ